MGRKQPPTSRRAFLRGAGGIMLGLPIADFLLGEDGKLMAADAATAPKRLITFCMPNGCFREQWTLDKGLAPIAPFQNKAKIFHTLDNSVGEMNPAVVPDNHARAGSVVFVGAPAVGAVQTGNGSIDIVAYENLKPNTFLPYISVGLTEYGGPNGCPYSVIRSWTSQGSPIPPQVDPLDVFNSIFGTAFNTTAAARQSRTSVIDAVLSMYKHVTTDAYGLNAKSKAKIAEHMDLVNDLEKKVRADADGRVKVCPKPDAAPKGNAAGYPTEADHFKALIDLVVLALRCDILRFGSVHYNTSCGGGIILPQFSPKSEHDLTHSTDGSQPTPFGRDILINYKQYYMSFVAYMVGQMDQITEPNGKTLLDNTLVLVAPDMADPDVHLKSPLPHALLGGEGAGIKAGAFDDAALSGLYTNDLYRTCLNALGVPAAYFGLQSNNARAISEILG